MPFTPPAIQQTISRSRYLDLVAAQLARLQAPGYTDETTERITARVTFARRCVDEMLMQLGFSIQD